MQENLGPKPPQDDADDQAAIKVPRASGNNDNVNKEGSRAVVPQASESKPKSTPRPRQKRKLTDEMQTEICSMISVGCSMRTAARLAGCSEASIRGLAERDEAFFERLRAACMRREVLPLSAILKASQTHWRAAAWYLSRLNREEYGYRRAETVSPVMLREWTDELHKAVLAALSDKAARRRFLRILDRLEPAPDAREEMRYVSMPYPFDARTEQENKLPRRRDRAP